MNSFDFLKKEWELAVDRLTQKSLSTAKWDSQSLAELAESESHFLGCTVGIMLVHNRDLITVHSLTK